MIGPSGCGKSTFIRCLNRMNDLVPGVKVGGKVSYHGEDLYGSDADPVEVRRRIGMVFQKPNPFPKSIRDNVAFAPKVLGMKGNIDERVERALRGAALWDEVKDRLDRSALALSGGQQQRLCIARALAVEPEVILLDEPASALDPISTAAIEDLMHELKSDYTLVIVTHNMQQAARVADMTAFFSLEVARERAPRHPGRVRRDREDLHPPVRQANRGLRHRALRMRNEFHRELERLEASSSARATSSCARFAPRSTALDDADNELADEVIRFDDEVDAVLPGDRGRASRTCSPRQTPVAVRPAARARDPAHQPPPRADGRLLRDDREARQADRGPAPGDRA